MKKLLSMITLIVFLVVLCNGCATKKSTDNQTKTDNSTTQATSSSTSSVNKSPVEITWWDYPSFTVPDKDNGIYENEIAADFSKENPNITVKVEMLPWDGGPEKINMAIASNSMPDIVLDYPGRLSGYAVQGVLAPLDNYIPESTKNDVPQSIWDQCMYNGKIYQYPMGGYPVAMGINKTLFEKIGATDLLPLNKPNREWTIDEFEAALTAVKDKAKDVVPIVLYAKNEMGDATIRMLIQNFGADLVDKDQKNIILNSEAGVKGMQWISDAYKKGLFAKGAETLSSSDAVDMFTQGKSAMIFIYGPLQHTGVQAKMKEGKVNKFEDVVVPLPHLPGVDMKAEVQIGSLCVFDNKDTSKIEASAKFIDYMWSNEKYKKANVIAAGVISIRSSVNDLYADDPEMKFFESIIKFSAESGYTLKNYSQIRTKWYPLLQAMLIGQLTPKEALDKFAQEGTAVLNK